MAVKIDSSWYEVLRPQFEASYFAQLKEFLVAERSQHTCYPPGSLIFSAFDRFDWHLEPHAHFICSRCTDIPKTCGDLSGWAEQGVLLLNATLTVRAHQAGSHQKHGWEQFTDAAIQALSQQRSGIVFLLWGSYAIAKKSLIDTTKHYVLTAPHPSPLSAYRGFFGCRHFSQTNNLLIRQGQQPVDWSRIK